MPYFTLLAGAFLLLNILLGEKIGFIIITGFTFMLYVGVHIIGKRHQKFNPYGMLLLYTANMA